MEPSFETIARFQSLQACQYWHAQCALATEGIEADTVLLIQSIRWVDDAPHTIILLPHPSKLGEQVYLDIPQEDGSTRRTSFIYDEHRFLLNDFLSAFEFEPDHQQIRNGEVREVQNRITSRQAELIEIQNSPALLASIVETGLHEQAKKAAANREHHIATIKANTAGSGFDRRYSPKTQTEVAITYKDDTACCMDVEVSGYSYCTHGDRTFNCKVSLAKLKSSRWRHGDLLFLCLDSVEPEDLRWYIQHRGSRRDHLAYIRFFKLALKYIELERADELGARQRLAQALADGNRQHSRSVRA